jgi:poly(3-hydroxyalkanoate) depolymerase
VSAVPDSGDRIQQVTVGRQPVRVAVRPGSADSPPLVIANGIGASLEALQPFVDALDRRIEVVRFDVPGVGGSPAASHPYTFAGLARVLGGALTALGYRHADILGVSWGGALAQQFAVQNPRRCRRLVLVSTATGALMIPAGPRVLSALVTRRRYRDQDYAASVAGKLYGGSLRTDPDQAREILHSQLRPGSRTGYAYQLLAGAGWTSLPFLPLIRQPTLVVAGRDDPIIPVANAHLMAALIPRARKLIHDDGHLALVTRAKELAPAISDFLLS